VFEFYLDLLRGELQAIRTFVGVNHFASVAAMQECAAIFALWRTVSSQSGRRQATRRRSTRSVSIFHRLVHGFNRFATCPI